MIKYLYAIFFVLLSVPSFCQFEFSGNVNEEFINSTVYLTSIDDYNRSSLFLTEQIIQESEIDSSGQFLFKGDFLSEKNKFYKIYIDKCNESVTDYNHLLDHCDDSNYIIFIANNNDTVYFPLNDFEQMFCSVQFSRTQNIAIHKIDSIQETLLVDLQDSKSDEQRKIIYKNAFKKLQKFSATLDEPLVELYAYQLYSDEKSFSRLTYLEDLKTSDYYSELETKLEESYPNSYYTKQYKEDLYRDQAHDHIGNFNIIIGVLSILLLVSLLTNFYLIQKRRKKKSKIDYKAVLSPQEQKVFELMKEKITNKEIADKLFISLSTVKTHINNIYSKLSISSRKEIHHFF
jgi:DNA-binding CsgD family transcriptional regulator